MAYKHGMSALGWIASAVFIIRLLPQPIRLVRTGVPDGVSPLSTLIAFDGALAWIVYGVEAHLPAIVVVSAVATPPLVATAVLLRRRTTRGDALVGGLWGLLVVLAWRAGCLGAVIAADVLLHVGPQVWIALRSDRLGGLSPATWRLAVADALLWGAYGWTSGDPALVGYGVILGSGAVTILLRLRWRPPPRPPAVEVVSCAT
jgi:uncharacterized protein with PQ loop repeat